MLVLKKIWSNKHAKVAEEAVAGWEKAENEVTMLKQELEAAVQQNLALEVRTNHLDAALKDCSKQLRLVKEEQEHKINEIVQEKTNEWEMTKKDLKIQICYLQAKSETKTPEYPSPIDPKILTKLETLEKENSKLKFELGVQAEELELRTIERDWSIQVAETASKSECRKLQSSARKSPSINDNHKPGSISSFYVDLLTDSQSVDSFKMPNLEHNESEDSWAMALMAEVDQFKTGKCVTESVKPCADEINNIMDDFLEMERIASLSEGQNETSVCNSEPEDNSKLELEVTNHRVCELEEKLEKLEAEKCELEKALNTSKESLVLSNDELANTKSQMADLQKWLTMVNESKELLESRLVNMEVEARIMSIEVDSVKAEVEKERSFSSEMTLKYERLEKEVAEKPEEVKLLMAANLSDELNVKQNLEVAAADRLSECQKTLSSLARQLESLATLEDFILDS